MRRSLTIAGILLGALALAACGSGGPGVQARQTGDTTTTTSAEPSTTTGTTPTTAAPETTPPSTAAPAPPCADDVLAAAYTLKFGSLDGASLRVLKCVDGWATSSQARGFDPPSTTLYRAEGDHWVAVNRGGGRLCTGQGVPPEVAPQIGCET